MQTIRCPHCQQEFAGRPGQDGACPLCGGVLQPEAFVDNAVPAAPPIAPQEAPASAPGRRSGRKWLLVGSAAAVSVAAVLLWYFAPADRQDDVEKPRFIISAQRTREIDSYIGGREVIRCNRDSDVLLLLTFRGVPNEFVNDVGDVRPDACKIIVNGKDRPAVKPVLLNPGADPKDRKFILHVTVPKDVLDMTLHIEGLGTSHFTAEEKIHETLVVRDE